MCTELYGTLSHVWICTSVTRRQIQGSFSVTGPGVSSLSLLSSTSTIPAPGCPLFLVHILFILKCCISQIRDNANFERSFSLFTISWKFIYIILYRSSSLVFISKLCYMEVSHFVWPSPIEMSQFWVITRMLLWTFAQVFLCAQIFTLLYDRHPRM